MPADQIPASTSRGKETFFDGKVFDPEDPARLPRQPGDQARRRQLSVRKAHAPDRESSAMNMPLVKAEPTAMMPPATAKMLPLAPKRPALAARVAGRLGELAVRVVPPVVVIALALLGLGAPLPRRGRDLAAAVAACSTTPGS